jgi:hypothetical protein
MNKKITALIAASVLGLVALSGCSSDADVASHNLSKEADNFKVERRIVFYNGITGQYILEVRGLCSVGNTDGPRQVSITCKTGPDEYKKHFLGLSDNVTWFAEQLQAGNVSTSHYKVIWKPSVVAPDVEHR